MSLGRTSAAKWRLTATLYLSKGAEIICSLDVPIARGYEG
jgi:hypothetical protein